MDESDGYERDELDDIIDASDTDNTLSTTASSIASSMFDRQHFVLELHELQKDEMPIERRTGPKVRKLQKKLKVPPVIRRRQSSDSSDSEDATLSPSIMDDSSREQYFDAHETYNGESENPMSGTDSETVSQENFARSEEQKIAKQQFVEFSHQPPTKEVRKLVKHPE